MLSLHRRTGILPLFIFFSLLLPGCDGATPAVEGGILPPEDDGGGIQDNYDAAAEPEEPREDTRRVAQLEAVEKCVGERTPCTSQVTEFGCEQQKCTWSHCGGTGTNCWDATNGGLNLGLCRELPPYCEVINDFFLGYRCGAKSTSSGSIPCTIFDGTDDPQDSCYDAGCTWSVNGSCQGVPVSCIALTAAQCETADGCRVVEQAEARCPASDCRCPEGTDRCGDTCIDTRTSALHCGACGVACDAHQSCQNGSCDDLDECAAQLAECPAHSTCANAAPGFLCVCEDGYAGDECKDVDECLNGQAQCPENAKCINTSGTFECPCLPGYTANGAQCEDINECEELDCDAHGTCTNSEGTYFCECDEGYQRQSTGCVPSDECVAAGLSCSELADCESADGVSQCVCHAGYHGDGETCEDKDECDLGDYTCGEHRVCKNEPGGYSCPCQPGYESQAGACVLTNLCLANEGCAAGETCVSTAAAFTCECAAVPSTTSCGNWLPVDADSIQVDTYGGAGYWFVAPRPMRFIAARSKNFKRPAAQGTITPTWGGSKTYAFYRLPRAPTGSVELMTDATLLGSCSGTDDKPCFPSITVAAGDRIGIVGYRFDANVDSWVGVRSSDITSSFVIDGSAVTIRPLFHNLGPSRQGPELIDGLDVWNVSSTTYGAIDVMWRAP